MTLVQEYDRWHERVFAANPDHPDENSPWYKLVLEYLAPIRGKRVLEVACGRGGFSQWLSSQGAAVCGVDFSGSALRTAVRKKLCETASETSACFVQADAQRLPFADGVFDMVISCETVEHLPDPQAAIREMARVCCSGGLLYLTTPNYANLMGLYELYAYSRHRQDQSAFAQPLDRHYVFFQIRSWLRAAGWEILGSDGTVHQVPVPGRNPVTLQFAESNRTVRRWLRAFALHYMVVGRKGARP